MAISKVVYKESANATPVTWMDATGVTATAGNIISPYTAMIADGTIATGTGSLGVSNIVTGTFTGTSTGAVVNINLTYSGSGHPIAFFIFCSDGGANTGTGSTYNRLQRYGCMEYYAVKSCITGTNATPTYNTDTIENQAYTINTFKNSTSDATNITRNATVGTVVFKNSDAVVGATTIARMKSDTVLSVFIANTGHGFFNNVEYKYVIVYSS